MNETADLTQIKMSTRKYI